MKYRQVTVTYKSGHVAKYWCFAEDLEALLANIEQLGGGYGGYKTEVLEADEIPWP